MDENLINTEKLINSDITAEFNALINAAIDGIIITDQHGKIELFNAAAETMFGYDSNAVIGKNIRILLPEPIPSDNDSDLEEYINTTEMQIIGKGREVEARRRSGEIFPIELSVGEIINSSHKQFVGIIRDITERVNLRSKAIANRERLAHASRLYTLGELVAGIAHEINQPLTAISSYSQACRNRLSGASPEDINPAFNADMENVLAKITDQALRAGQIISRLRGFVEKRHRLLETLPLNGLIRDTVELAKVDTRILQHGIKLRLKTDPEPMVTVDPTQIQQVLFNLINNAVDAMENQPKHPVVILSRWITGDAIEVAVIDRGHGVKQEYLNTLFDPFVTSKEHGMGIGLPISQSIITAHGGKLSHCKGNPNGSIFAFELPAKPFHANVE